MPSFITTQTLLHGKPEILMVCIPVVSMIIIFTSKIVLRKFPVQSKQNQVLCGIDSIIVNSNAELILVYMTIRQRRVFLLHGRFCVTQL